MNKISCYVLLFFMAMPITIIADDTPVAEAAAAEKLQKGRELAFERRKGNCLACHLIEGGDLTGNYGPPLLQMKARFPDRDVLRAKVWDASVSIPDTRMPPFGRHRIMTEDEIDLVVDFILTL